MALFLHIVVFLSSYDSNYKQHFSDMQGDSQPHAS